MNNTSFLDDAGLVRLWDKIKAQSGGGSSNVDVLTCDTARNVAAKVVTFTGFELTEGAHIFVRFTSTATANPSSGNITLNVNNTGAKTIVDSHINGSTVLTYSNGDIFCNSKVCEFVYDGTYWVLINRGETSSTDYLITSSGIKICWGFTENSSDSFPISYKSAPIVVATPYYAGSSGTITLWINSITTSSVSFTKATGVRGAYWIAIGK